MPNPNLAMTQVSAVLTTGTAVVHTVPAGEEQSVSVRVVGYSTAATTVTWWMVPSGEVLADKHLGFKDFALAAKDGKEVETALAMRAGDRLYAAASANTSVVFRVTGTRLVL